MKHVTCWPARSSFFLPGIPQVYYAGLLCAHNDMDLLAATGVGRDINRPFYTLAEIEAQPCLTGGAPVDRPHPAA